MVILGKIERELKKREEYKDKLYDAMRKATRLSKQAIFFVHRGRFDKARESLKEAEKLLGRLAEIPRVYEELVHRGIVDSAFQEYAEAHVFLKLTQENKFVGPEKIDVPSPSFILGLADVVGELRRWVLDSLREGDVKRAERGLELMEQIYNALVGMDEALHAVSELRRKNDVARRIVESTRGDVTIEVRRDSLERSIKKFERTLKTKAK